MASPLTVQTRNPGAITDGPWARSQPGYVGANGDFAVFDTPDSGRAAQLKLLNNYVSSGHNSISAIINKWAPQAANSPGSTGNYAAYVAQRTGLEPNAPLTPDQLGSVATAQQEWESGLKKNGFTPPVGAAASASSVDPDVARALSTLQAPDVPAAPQSAAGTPSSSAQQDPDVARALSTLAPDAADPGSPAAPAPIDVGPGTFAGKPTTTGALGNNPMAVKKSNAAPQPTGYTPSAVPFLDPINAGVNNLIDNIPFGVGATLTKVGNSVDAGFNNLLGLPTETPQDRAAVNTAESKQFPAMAATGAVIGNVAPYLLAGPESLAAKALGTAGDYGFGVAGNLAARAAAGGASAAVSQGLDQAARGDTSNIGRNMLTAGLTGTLAAPVAGMLGNAKGLLARSAIGAGTGAAIGGGSTLLAGGSLQDAGQNAFMGAGIGAGVGAGASVAGTLANRLMQGGIDNGTASLADAAINKYGIPLGAADISANPMVKVAKSVVDKMPFSGGTSSNAAQNSAFQGAIAREMGSTASDLSPATMSAAKARIGNVFQSAANNTPAIRADPQFDNEVMGVMSSLHSSAESGAIPAVNTQFDNLMNSFQKGGNSITGRQYLSMTAKGSDLDEALNSENPTIAQYAMRLKDALDGAFQRSASPEDAAALQQARYQWKVMRTVQDPAAKSQATGNLSPALLAGAVRKNFPSMAYDGAGNMGELANIGQRFLVAPGSSQTSERGFINNLLTFGGAGGIYAAPHVAIPALAGTLAASTAAGAAMRSRWLANSLLQGPQFDPVMNKLTRASVPLLAPAIPQGPLKITVRGATPIQ